MGISENLPRLCRGSVAKVFAVGVVFAPAVSTNQVYNFQNYQTANSEVICYQPIQPILALVAILAIPSAFGNVKQTLL